MYGACHLFLCHQSVPVQHMQALTQECMWHADAPWTVRATKLYLYYPQAWWIAGGYTNGSLYDDNIEDLDTPIVARWCPSQLPGC